MIGPDSLTTALALLNLTDPRTVRVEDVQGSLAASVRRSLACGERLALSRLVRACADAAPGGVSVHLLTEDEDGRQTWRIDLSDGRHALALTFGPLDARDVRAARPDAPA